MKEFIEKLIGRLEEQKDKYFDECFFQKIMATEDTIEIINELAEEYKGGWIACSEKLPETYDNLLICQSDGYVNVGYFSIGEFKDNNSCLYKDVIAWMPLPAPYKEGCE